MLTGLRICSSFSPAREIILAMICLIVGGCARGSYGPATQLDRPIPDNRSWDKGVRPVGVGREPPPYSGNTAGTPGSIVEFKSIATDVVYFSSDQTDLTPEAQEVLIRQARWLQQYRNHIFTIEGHADERGTREYNIALGSRRAAMVRQFLVLQGVAAGRIKTVSFGKERPVAVCDDLSCWSRNRRAETVLQNRSVSRY